LAQIWHFLFLDEKKQKSRLCIVLNGKIADSRLAPTNSPWCVVGKWGVGNCMMPGFQVVGRVGSNNVSAPLRGRRLPAIFPKRCKAGGQAGSSWVGLPGRWLGGKYYIFFCLDAKETKDQGSASFLTGKSQTADSRLQTRLDAGWVKGAQGIA
jgi:hypothetical protein